MLFLFPILIIWFVNTRAQYVAKAHCPKNQDCSWKFPQFVTQNLKCINKFQCPRGFLCCPDCNYEHNVCKAAIWIRVDDYDACPKDLKFCSLPLDYDKTKHYKCTSHVQCYKTDLCCPDSCYTHKVCKSTLQHVQTPKYVCPISIRKALCPNTNRTLTKYSCQTDGDCFPGYICCQDNCYDHMVCKLSKDAFSYRSVYQPSNYTTPAHIEGQYKCPEVEEKCSKPYSLRLAKKYICFKDENCKVGQMCCKDSCVKDFKICKDLFTIKPSNMGLVTKEWEIFENSTVSPHMQKETELKQNDHQKTTNPKDKDKSVSLKSLNIKKSLSNKESEFYFIEGSGFDSDFEDDEN